MYDEDRIRQKAYELWVAEGCPPGRDQHHWDAAKEMLALADGGLAAATIPVADSLERAESLIPEEGAADVPGLTDQGEDRPVPKPAAKRARKPKAEAAAPAPAAPEPAAEPPAPAKPRAPRKAKAPAV